MSTYHHLTISTPKLPVICEADDRPPPYSSPAPPDSEGPSVRPLVTEVARSRDHPVSVSHYPSYPLHNPASASSIHSATNYHGSQNGHPTLVSLSNQSGIETSPPSSRHLSGASFDPVIRDASHPPFVRERNLSSSSFSPSRHPTASSHFSRRTLIALAIVGVFIIGGIVGGVVGTVVGKQHGSSVATAAPAPPSAPDTSEGLPTGAQTQPIGTSSAYPSFITQPVATSSSSSAARATSAIGTGP
ncbi:hypothetical protein JAAARDRAFT_40302 [Jaapia argillacea MUCL 33604]|uniref:Uncharacterized protein n=1 Tax=Jaapia argillacea MUCL 33604 TaxID=933084 RepID=A0A067PC42_9AGAM|nr:hypothetical protein JAAARDRAFT_40302 [Jaapia argillacea MUCL 33604]